MFKHTRTLAATLALSAAILGASGFYAATFADNKAQKQEKSSDAAMQAELAKALAAMTDPGGPSGLASRIALSDRNRVADALKKADTAEYKKMVEDLQKAWKDKFGHEFDAEKHASDLASGNQISRFEYEKKDYVSVTFAKTQYEPESELRYVHNEDNYRLTLANDLTGEQLAERVRRAMFRVLEFKQQWGRDENETYKGVARLMLATLDYDAPHTRSAERNKK